MTKTFAPLDTGMVHLWYNWSMLSFEAAQVIGLRMMLLAGGGKTAERETQRMVEEKMQAMMQVGLKLAFGQWGTTPQGQMAGATQVYGRKVHANLRRLT
jgi:hypothetical protein